MDDDRPIFLQVAELIERQIIDGAMAEETQVPSTNELAVFHRINPATALRGINRLVDAGVLYKQRGIGMFVASGARERLLVRRREAFSVEYIRPLATEAARLGLTPQQVMALIQEETRR